MLPSASALGNGEGLPTAAEPHLMLSLPIRAVHLATVPVKHVIYSVRRREVLTDSLMNKIKFDTHLNADTPSSAVGEQSPRAAVCVTQMEESRVE